jgi:outer membrane protein, adhesin transport system
MGHFRSLRVALRLGVGACVLAALSGTAGAQSLEEAMRIALRSNPEVLSSGFSREAANQDLRQARAGYLPQVDIRAGYGRQWSDNNSTRLAPLPAGNARTVGLNRTESQLTVRQLLWDFGGVDAQVEGAIARRAQNAHRVREVSEVIALRVSDYYIDLLRQMNLFRVAQENVTNHQQITGRVGARLRQGRGDQADEQQAQSRLNVARAAFAESQGRVREAQARFLSVVGQPAGALASVQAPFNAIPASDEEAVRMAEAQSPTIQAFRAQVEFTRASIDEANARFLPRVDLEAGGSLNNNVDGVRGRENDARVMVMMRQNLYAGGADMARRGAAVARSSEAQQNLARATRDTSELVRVAYSQLSSARERLEVFRQQEQNARRVRVAYDQQFNLGTRSLLDLLDSENELFVSRSNVIDIEHLVIFRAYRVLAAMGVLLPTMGIDPPPEASVPARGGSWLTGR